MKIYFSLKPKYRRTEGISSDDEDDDDDGYLHQTEGTACQKMAAQSSRARELRHRCTGHWSRDSLQVT